VHVAASGRDRGTRESVALARVTLHGAMSARINMVRVRKDLLIRRVREQVRDTALVAVASMGSLSSAEKFRVRYDLHQAGATVNFTKNSLVSKGLEGLGPEAQGLAPLLRGGTLLACGPAEVPLAKQLQSLEKTLPGFYVAGALLNSQRILQARSRPAIGAPSPPRRAALSAPSAVARRRESWSG
jgi:ribosomal protein L10